ncbi:MAG TPA: zf-HC2 domain-containing protein [Anaeromyxobacter sp.]
MRPTRHPLEELTALVDGALAPARAAEVQRHVEACPACRAEKERLAAAVAALHRLPPAPEPSPLFATRLSARLAREQRPSRSWAARLGGWADLSSLRWRIAAPAAAAVLATGVVVAAIRIQRAEETAVAENLDLLLDYEAVSSLGDVDGAEDVGVVAQLDELEPKRGTP